MLKKKSTADQSLSVAIPDLKFVFISFRIQYVYCALKIKGIVNGPEFLQALISGRRLELYNFKCFCSKRYRKPGKIDYQVSGINESIDIKEQLNA